MVERYYRPQLKEKITKYCRECDSCQKIKSFQSKKKAELFLILPTKPGKLMTFDIAGPFIQTVSGNRYFIVLCDHFSKFLSIYPLKKTTAETVANVLMDHMCRYGISESKAKYYSTKGPTSCRSYWN